MIVPKVKTGQTARTLTIPAPVGGLNGRDSLAAMPQHDAFVLDNLVPGTATCEGRGGFTTHSSGFGAPVESVVPYVGGASRKLLAFAGGKVFDASTPNPPAYQNDGTDTTGFTLTANCTLDSVGGRLRVGINGGGVIQGASVSFATVIGTVYTVSLDCTATTGGGLFVTVPGSFSVLGVGNSLLVNFTATALVSTISFGANNNVAGNWTEFDNVYVASVLPVAIQSGRVGNRIISTMFSNAGAQFLIGVSGLDVAFSYDGTTFSNLAITGITGSAANLSHVFTFKGRLFFAQKDQLGFYYLAVGAIQGAASYFDLSQVARKGGYLVASASFSADSGNGPADYAVFITSEGEYIVYAGTDPSNASNWALVGRYYAAPPIGRKCTFNYGSELVIITMDGAVPFSAIRAEGDAADKDAITYKLGRLLQDQNVNSAVQGWEALLYGRKSLLVFNVPITSSPAGAYVQFVQNTVTKAWTRFTGLNALCWTEFSGDLYFGTYNGNIKHYDTAQSDDGKAIQVECRQAWNYFEDGSGTTNSNKHFHFAKLLLGSDGNPPLNAQFNVDYVDDQPQAVAANLATSGAVWDVAAWDTVLWGGDIQTQFVMLSLGKYGVAGSLWLRASLQGLTLKWYATQYIFSKAQGLF